MNVVIYQSELEYLSRYTLDYPNIETGGQLFGFWKEDGTPVVTFVIGPGEKANHEIAFFQQDIDYLEKIGNSLTLFHGLKHIGEWHSHHTLGLNKPSGHDAANIQSKVDEYGFSQFLLCIGTISKSTSSITPYIFAKAETNYVTAKWSVINGTSPSRVSSLKTDLLMPQTKEANYDIESVECLEKIIIPESVNKVENYWFSDKANQPVLKRIIDEINKDGIGKCQLFMDEDNHVLLEISKNEEVISVLFPDGFPNKPPLCEFSNINEWVQTEWKFNGDIYESFMKYYKQLIK